MKKHLSILRLNYQNDSVIAQIEYDKISIQAAEVSAKQTEVTLISASLTRGIRFRVNEKVFSTKFSLKLLEWIDRSSLLRIYVRSIIMLSSFFIGLFFLGGNLGLAGILFATFNGYATYLYFKWSDSEIRTALAYSVFIFVAFSLLASYLSFNGKVVWYFLSVYAGVFWLAIAAKQLPSRILNKIFIPVLILLLSSKVIFLTILIINNGHSSGYFLFKEFVITTSFESLTLRLISDCLYFSSKYTFIVSLFICSALILPVFKIASGKILKYYLTGTWVIMIVISFFLTVGLTKFVSDEMLQRNAAGSEIVRQENLFKAGKKTWAKPAFWNAKPYSTVDRVIEISNVLFQVQPVRPQLVFRYNENKEVILLATAKVNQKRTIEIFRTYLKFQETLLFGLYLNMEASVPLPFKENTDGRLTGFVFYDLKMHQLENLYLYTVPYKVSEYEETLIFAFKLPRDASPLDIMTMIWSGFSK